MNILKYKVFYLLLSAIILVPGIVSLFVNGLNLSIDFTGGSLFKYQFEDTKDINININENKLRDVFKKNEITVENISKEENNTYIIKTKPIDVSKSGKLKEDILSNFSNAKQLSFETVGPSIGEETTRKAFTSLAWVSVGIVLYIAFAFRNVPKPYSSFRFGISAIIAMLHDAVLVVGVFSILGYFYKIEVDALFITAVLTVIGFSVHDSIVVFDRIRENLKKLPHSMSFEEVSNYSLVETLNRSLSTSLTVVFTLLALYLLGGSSIKTFVLALLIGIVSGTYSSIFTATPILVIWENIKNRKK